MNAQPKDLRLPQLYDIELEQMLLGGVIAQDRAFWAVSELVTDRDFYDPFHATVWKALAGRRIKSEPVDFSSLSAILRPYLHRLASEEKFEGEEYLRGIIQAAPASFDARGVGRTLVDLARRRRIVEAAQETMDAAYFDTELTPDQIADRMGEAVYDAAHANEPGNGPEPLIDVIRRAADAAEQARLNPNRARITTGLPSVDAKLGGFFPRDLHILGAASSMGKSGLIGQMALSASRAGYTPLVFSIEMASEEVATRFLAVDSGVPANRIAEGRTGRHDTQRIADATQAYSDGKFFLDGSSNLSMAQIRARAQAVKRRNGALDLIVVDHLRLVRATDMRAPEHERLDQITKDAKALAKDLDCAMLLIAPFNRELWKRDSHRPLISDLYGASAIEYNADHIWFLHREEFFLDRTAPDASDAKRHTEWLAKLEASKGLAEVFGAKRRGGPLGSAILGFDAPLVRFYERDDQSTQQETMF